MVDYGNGVGQVAGRAAGGHGGGSTTDIGAGLSRFMTESAHTVSTMPPAALLAAFVVIILGLFLLKRAF